MDDLRFGVLFIIISVISGRCERDSEKISATEPFTIEKIFASNRSQTRDR